jgi:hypothetical protein
VVPDERPRSLLGRLWRFHANFCPGWKAYMSSLPDGEKRASIDRYALPADRFA